MVLAAFLVIFAMVGCGEDVSEKTPTATGGELAGGGKEPGSPAEGPVSVSRMVSLNPSSESYELISETYSDSKARSQVEWKILVSGDVLRGPMRNILEKAYQESLIAKEFQHFNPPNSVWISAYDSRENAGTNPDGWIAIVYKPSYELAPSYLIRKPLTEPDRLTDKELALNNTLLKLLEGEDNPAFSQLPRELSGSEMSEWQADLDEKVREWELEKKRSVAAAAGISIEEFDEILLRVKIETLKQ